nr:nucleotidyltransferase family protein [Alicyclobacillus sp. SO9]
MDSSVPWSVKNQARMHIKNGHNPYTSTADGLDCRCANRTEMRHKIRRGRGEPLYELPQSTSPLLSPVRSVF